MENEIYSLEPEYFVFFPRETPVITINVGTIKIRNRPNNSFIRWFFFKRNIEMENILITSWDDNIMMVAVYKSISQLRMKKD